MYVDGHGSRGKIGVKHKKNFQCQKPLKKKNVRYFTFYYIKDRSKYAKQKIFPEKNFVNRRALQFVPFMMVGTVKNRPLNADAISVAENFIFQYFGKPRWSQIILD